MPSFKKAFDQIRLGLGRSLLSTMEIQLDLGWAFFIFDELQSLKGEVLCDALVASLALQASRPCPPLVFVAALCVSDVQEKLVFLVYVYIYTHTHTAKTYIYIYTHIYA